MAAKITNTVEFKIDRQSFNAAKKAMKDLQDFGNKLKVGGGGLDEYKRRALAAEKELAKARAAAAAAQNNQNNSNNAAQAKAERERLAAIKRAETAELRRNNVAHQLRMIQGATVEEQLKIARLAARLTSEYQNGNISVRRMNQELSQQVALLRRAAAERRRANGGAGGAGGAGEGGSGGGSGAGAAAGGFLARGLSMGTLAAGAGAAALTAAVVKGVDTARDNVRENAAIVNGSKAVGVDPNVLLAMSQWGKMHGVADTSPERLQDNFKDANERLAEQNNPVTAASWNAKKGQYTGGNSAITEIMNVLHLKPEDIQQYQHRPLDFASMVATRGQQMGLSDDETGHLLENVGNDLMYYAGALKDNGSQLMTTFQQLKDAGAALTPEFVALVEKGQAFDNAMTVGEQALSNQFTAGLLESVGGLDGLKDVLKALNPIARWFGDQLGNLVKNILSLVNSIVGVYNNVAKYIPGLTPIATSTPTKAPGTTPATTPAAGGSPAIPAPGNKGTTTIDPATGLATNNAAATDNASASSDRFWNYVSGFGARFHEANQDLLHPFTDRTSIANTSIQDNGKIADPTVPSSAAGAAAQQAPTNVNVTVTVKPDGTAMSNAVKATAQAVVNNNNNQQALSIASGGSR